MPTPPFITTREAVVQRRYLKNFPEQGSWTINLKSVSHQDRPENPNKFVRIEVNAIGMIIKEAP